MMWQLFGMLNVVTSQIIAFGACYSSKDPNTPIFRLIGRPDVFIWLGDAAYVTKPIAGGRAIPQTNPELIKEDFDRTKNHPDYAKLRESTQIEGVWDDHDYNMSDGTHTNFTKHMVRQLYLDFLGVSNDDVRRTRVDGIYYSFMVNDRTKIILLDVRWNRNPETQDTLGESQWEWLAEELNDDYMFIIGSGSQIIPDDRLFIDVFYKTSRDRILSMLNGKNVIIISGDVHFTELLQDPCTGIIEATSSGISYGHHYRSILKGLFIFFAELFQPDSYSVDRFAVRNYGVINLYENTIQLHSDDGLLLESSFDRKPNITCQDLNGSVFLRYFWNFPQKLYKFTGLLLFKQLLVIAIIGLIGLVVLIAMYKLKQRYKTHVNVHVKQQ